MIGYGEIGPQDRQGTLAHLVREKGEFRHLVDASGAWLPRYDVWCIQATAGDRSDWLQPGFGARPGHFGPELGFGHAVGDHHEAPVLLLKSAMGNRSLGWDILPPSSRDRGTGRPVGKFYRGWQYDRFIQDVRDVLADLPDRFPFHKVADGYEIAGFVWWQGQKDATRPEWSKSYEQNLANLIRDLRSEFEAPDAVFVLGTIGFGGEAMADEYKPILKAQLALADPDKYPEFADNVAAIDTRPFWRAAEESPRKAIHHYHHNAETYLRVGDALGRAVVRLLTGEDAAPMDD